MAYGLAGIWGERITSFQRFAENILGADFVAIGNAERLLVVRKALEKASPFLAKDVAEGVSYTGGIATHVLRVIEALKQAAVDPETFMERLQQRNNPSEWDNGVAAVYSAYQELLRQQGFYDRIGTLWAAAEICERSAPPYLTANDILLFDGFDDFTPSELRLIETIAVHVPSVVIGLNLDRSSEKEDLYRLPTRSLCELQNGLHATVEDLPETKARSLTEFSAQYLLCEGVPSGHTEDIERNITVTAYGLWFDELENTAREVKRLIVEENASPEEIAVVVADLSSVSGTLQAIFDMFGVPVVMDVSVPLAKTALGSFVLNVVTAAAQAWPKDVATDLFASPWFEPKNAIEAQAGAFAFSLGRMLGATRGVESWLEGVNRLLGDDEQADKASVPEPLNHYPNWAALLRAFRERIERIKGWVESLPVSGSASDFVAALYRLMMEAGAHARAQRTDMTDATGESVLLNRVRHVLRSIELWDKTCGGSEQFTRETFSKLVHQAFHAEELKFPRETNGVLITTPEAVRNRQFAYVFFCGVNEGIIPTAPASNAIYNTEDIKDFRRAGIPFDTAIETTQRQWTVFQHVLASARKYLYISWRTMNPDGRELRKSPFLVELLRVLGGAIEEQTRLHAESFVPEIDTIGSLRDLRALAAFRHNDWQNVFPEELSPVFRGISVEADRQSSKPFGKYDGVLSSEDALRLLREHLDHDHVFSVNQIEAFVECPFRYFVQHVLRIVPVESYGEDWETCKRGAMIHSVLAQFHSLHPRLPLARIPNAKTGLLALLDEFVNQEKSMVPTNFQGRFLAQQLAVRSLLKQYVVFYGGEDDGWAPVAFEVSFGDVTKDKEAADASAKAFVVSTPQGDIRFRGRIDRIDERGHQVRVIDYKTGKAPSLSHIENGKSVQLPVYVLAAEHLYPEKECTEARYFTLAEKATSKCLDKEDQETWAGCLDQARKTIAEIVQAMRDGKFPPTPSNTACQNCPEREVCRYDEGRVARKKGAPSP